MIRVGDDLEHLPSAPVGKQIERSGEAILESCSHQRVHRTYIDTSKKGPSTAHLYRER